MFPTGLRQMEELRFKVWLQLYHWRKPALVLVTSFLILLGFFFMLSITQFEDLPTTKREGYGSQTLEKKLHSILMKQEYHSLPKLKSSNPSVIRFLINEPYFCLEKKLLYIIAISSSPENVEKRMAIRSTWGNPDVLNQTDGAIVFLLGKVRNDRRLQKQIYEESMRHRDLIQGDFIDSYKNLTQKSILALKWFSSYCSQVKFLMKTDDDVFTNTKHLAKFLRGNEFKKRWIVGCVKTHAAFPVKMKNNKAVPVLTLPYGHPTFVAGAGYVISSDIVESLYEKSQRIKFIPVEDVFVTGHCAKVLGVIPEHNPHFTCGEAYRDFCTLVDSKITGHRITADQQKEIWNMINNSKSCKRSKSSGLKKA